MEENKKKKTTNGKEPGRRPAFTVIDWIIAALSIALMIFILLNIPVY